MALTNLSQVTSSGIHTLSNYTTHNINSTGIITATSFSGNLSSASGISTFAEIRVTGNLTVEGTTTTLDSNLTEVDRIEVGANSTNPGIAVTQSGTGAAATFEGGNFGIGTNNPGANLDIAETGFVNVKVRTSGNNSATLNLQNSQRNFSVNNITGGAFTIHDATANTERLRINSGGQVLVGTVIAPAYTNRRLTVATTSGTTAIEVRSATNGDGRIYFTDNTTSGNVGAYAGKLMYDHTDNYMAFYTGGDDATPGERLRITSGGNVGINQTSPAAPLSFNTGVGQKIELYNQGTNNEFGIGVENSELRISSGGNSFIAFRTGGYSGDERFRITADGKVAIGFNAPAVAGLSIANSSTSLGFEFDTASGFASGPTIRGYHRPSTTYKSLGITGADIKFGINDVEKLRLDSNGYLGLNNAAPHNQYYNNLVIGDGSAAGDKGITIRTQSSNEGVIAFSDADSGAARYAGKIAYNHGTNAMMFFTANGDERLRIDSNGSALLTTTGQNTQYSYAMKLGQGAYLPNDSTAPHYGLWVRQLGPRYELNYGVYSEVEDDNGFYGGETLDGLSSVRGVGVFGGSPSSNQSYQKGIGVYGKATNSNYNYNTVIGVRGRVETGTTTFTANNGQQSFGGHFVATGKADCVGVYADAYLDGSPGANQTAAPLVVASNGSEKIRVDNVGRLLIGRTTNLASSAERLTIDNGMALFRRNHATAGAVYIRNEDSTADTRHPYLIFMDGGGNRGGFGIQNDQSSLWISGQNGIAFRTSGSAPSQNERLRITTGGFVNIGGNFTQTNYTAQVTRIGGNTDVMQIKGNVGNAFIRFADNDATSDFTLGSDDGSGAGAGAFILYDRNNSVYRLVMNSSGYLGIGVNNPQKALHISGNSAAITRTNGLLFFSKDGEGVNTNTNNTHWIGRVDSAGHHATSGAGGFNSVAGAFAIGAKGPLMFATSANNDTYSTGRMIITTDGKVAINETTPDTRLTVNGSINVQTGVFGKRFAGSTTVDTGLMVGTEGTFSHAVIEVIVSGNPNHFGSAYYRASSTYLVHIGTGWTGSAISTIINATRVSYGVGGSGNSSQVTASFVLYNANNNQEYSSGTARSSAHQLRVKIAGCSTASGARCFVKVLSNDSWLD